MHLYRAFPICSTSSKRYRAGLGSEVSLQRCHDRHFLSIHDLTSLTQPINLWQDPWGKGGGGPLVSPRLLLIMYEVV